MQPQCCVSFVSVRDEPTKKDFAKIDVSPYGEPVDDIGPLSVAVRRGKPQGLLKAATVGGANVVHSSSGGAPWAEIRALIEACPDLSPAARRKLIDLGDKVTVETGGGA